jgi:penicillin-binding protein 2B
MKKLISTDKVVINKFVWVSVLLFFVVILFRVGFLSISSTVDGTNLKEFASNRNTKEEIVYANRGAIYDVQGNMLAQSINSYTVIAYLDPNRSDEKNIRHVVDKENTAKKLSEIINMTEESILALLNKELYQVELGPGGRGITEITKEKIEELELPGISFISSYKRYYPNGEFLSYVLGYVRNDDDGQMIGEMGIEEYYNSQLKGKDGNTIYQQDLKGLKIPNTPEIVNESENGVDIYLTIDSNIQYFAETVAKEAYEDYNPEWLIATVMDAKTGAILASTSYPSFDPNTKDMTNYLNPLVSYSYEPGSTMKTFTYMAVMEKGNYNGKDTFKSGNITFENTDDTISDWKPEGWGTINYDTGFTLSANTGIVNLTRKYINGGELKDYYKKLGFGSKTQITLPKELPGKLSFAYPIEIANAGFGQGIMVTPIQMLQAMTAISNDGTILKPYIVEKIVNTNSGEIEYTGKKEEIANVASTATINKMKDLMYTVINGDSSIATGGSYKIEGYDIIGKTGTAQYINPKTGKYYKTDANYIRSFIGMFPKDDPQIIIYVVVKKATSSAVVYNTVKPLIEDIANYKGLFKDIFEDSSITNYSMPNLLNKNHETAEEIINQYTNNVFIIGNGEEIKSQYPKSNVTVNSLNNVFLITNYDNLKIPNITGMSLK